MSATTVALAIELVIQLLNKSTDIATLISKAQAEGRTDLTIDEWTSIVSADDNARAKLVEAIANAVLAKAQAKAPGA